jgi:signal transduction histidine kinase
LTGKKTEVSYEHRIIRPDGAIRWVQSIGKATRDPGSNHIRFTGDLIDITERKKVEADREILIAGLSHDLRNPLAAVRTHADLLQRYHFSRKKLHASMNRILTNVERADRMIQDMLYLARMRADGKQSLMYQECDLIAVVSDWVRELVMRFGDRFEFRVKGNFLGCWPAEDIRRVIENLAENAVKYGDPDKHIQIKLAMQAGSKNLELSVKNEGNPIHPEDQENILRPFGRGKYVTRSEQIKGWGLGLAVVRAFVEAVGGTLSLESSESKGTVFKITMPFTELQTSQLASAS